MDRDSESAELANYFSKFSAALTRLDEELARWKNYEADYEALKTTLLDLPKETTHSVMVYMDTLLLFFAFIITGIWESKKRHNKTKTGNWRLQNFPFLFILPTLLGPYWQFGVHAWAIDPYQRGVGHAWR